MDYLTPQNPLEEKAQQACTACRKQKRKCDKALPNCTLCSRMGRRCEYPEIKNGTHDGGEELTWLKERVRELENRLAASPASDNVGNAEISRNSTRHEAKEFSLGFGKDQNTGGELEFPATFFLDIDAFNNSLSSIQKPLLTVPEEMINILGGYTELQVLLDQYFQSIHIWLPVVSKKRLYSALATSEHSAELALLYGAIYLICTKGTTSPTDIPIYWMVKQFLVTAETRGLFSVRMLQAAVLIAAYEIGHGVYPAAYLSVGHCGRLGQAMGLHDRQNAPQAIRAIGTWGAHEELKRVYVNIGSKGRPLSCGEFVNGETLPSEDSLWDAGEVTTSQPIFVTSPTKVKVGPFARACQASYLMGKVIEHKNDRELVAPFRHTNALQLHRTISALSSLLAGEFEMTPGRLSTAMALCFSAILDLYEPYCCDLTNEGQNTVEGTEMQAVAIDRVKAISQEIVQFGQCLSRTLAYDVSTVSPLACDCLYQGLATLMWFEKETGDAQWSHSAAQMAGLLQKINERWGIAGKLHAFLKVGIGADI
ncbi:hypothetical protein AJ79_04556 [Helicocarpus griseus UAMH5409]|uniref:Zn(2)-C6 fungal-type domain-containing protein n=1 Tax=Helicocarpus griseus UAMH5409 TaxID=1447875 RepID=A0A2B7XSN8_9EURO|nr:hypothetical protein AJ79_04556 [Helicocarpus griseus UAMH5409]